MKLFLNKILADRNISVNELHKMTKISRTTLDPLNKVDYLPLKTRFETIKRISESLNVPINELIAFDENIENYSVETIEKIKQDFDPYIGEYTEATLLRVNTNSSRYYLLVLFARFSPGKKFERRFSKELNRLSEILELTRDSVSDERTKYDIEFEELYDFLRSEGYKEKNDFIFSADYSFSVSDFSRATKLHSFKSEYTDLLINSTHLGTVISNDDFIRSVSKHIADIYKLKSSRTEHILDIWEIPKDVPKTDEVMLVETDYVTITYNSNTKNMEKTTNHIYYYNE